MRSKIEVIDFKTFMAGNHRKPSKSLINTSLSTRKHIGSSSNRK
ncbi:hypothetical protein [Peribacillus butanolivorans]